MNVQLCDYGKRIEAYDGDGPDATFLGYAAKAVCTGWYVHVGDDGLGKHEGSKADAKRRLKILIEATAREARAATA